MDIPDDTCGKITIHNNIYKSEDLCNCISTAKLQERTQLLTPLRFNSFLRLFVLTFSFTLHLLLHSADQEQNLPVLCELRRLLNSKLLIIDPYLLYRLYSAVTYGNKIDIVNRFCIGLH